MRKRRLLLFASLPLVVVLALGVYAMIPPPQPGFIKANYDRIQEGMTLAEVEEIFGKKATSWRNDSHALWIDDEGYAGMLFIDNRVADRYCHVYGNSCNPTFFQKIRGWLP